MRVFECIIRAFQKIGESSKSPQVRDLASNEQKWHSAILSLDQDPCTQWKEILDLTHPDDLGEEDRFALEQHLETCPSCLAIRRQNTIMGALVRQLPFKDLSEDEIPSMLPLQLLQQWELEDRQRNKLSVQLEPLWKGKEAKDAADMVPALVMSNGYREATPFRRNTHKTYQKLLMAACALFTLLLVGLVAWNGNTTQSRASGLTFSLESQKPRDLSVWVHNVTWSPNGEDIASLWSDNTVQVWSAHDGQEYFRIQVGWGHALAFSPDGKYLASVGADSTVQILDVNRCKNNPSGCKPLFVYQDHTAPVEVAAWSPDSTLIASAGDDMTVRVWDTSTGKTWAVYGHLSSPARFQALAWSPDGKRLVSGDDNGSVNVWDAKSGTQILSYLGHKNDPLNSVSWSSDGGTIASAGYKGLVHVWDAKSGQIKQTLPTGNGESTGQRDPIFAVVWRPGGFPVPGSQYIAFVSYDTVQVWDALGGQRVAIDHLSKYSQKKTNRDIFSVSWSPDGRRLVCGGQGVVLELKL